MTIDIFGRPASGGSTNLSQVFQRLNNNETNINTNATSIATTQNDLNNHPAFPS
jgi:hypothetical protein